MRRTPSARSSSASTRCSLFAGEYDAKNAVVTISAGAGGTEATDWADMLLRMYLRWCERHRFKADVIDSQPGSRRGSRARLSQSPGGFAYGWLRAERGVRRLVRISPYDAQNRRQTTFALVEVMPEADEDVEIEFNWDEIRVDTFRSSGAGGQHVQKTESAIRLTHLPAGIVVTCQERALRDAEPRGSRSASSSPGSSSWSWRSARRRHARARRAAST